MPLICLPTRLHSSLRKSLCCSHYHAVCSRFVPLLIFSGSFLSLQYIFFLCLSSYSSYSCVYFSSCTPCDSSQCFNQLLAVHISLPAVIRIAPFFVSSQVRKDNTLYSSPQRARVVVSGKHSCSITEMKALLIRFIEICKRKY